MAITFITGIPRSGKSYYAVHLLYQNFIALPPKETKLSKFLDKYSSKKLKKSYEIAYTNINQFDFSKSDKIKPFDYDTFQAKLVILHSAYLAKKSDDELIAMAKSFGLTDCLFVIDEAQNFFAKENTVSTWWFTYHGHLHQDIILITQNLDYIFSNYSKTAEFFYKAVPPSSRIFSNKMRYVQYNSYKCYQKDKIGDFHVPIDNKVFSLYVSGASNNAPSQVKKYLWIFGFLMVIAIIVFNMFTSQFKSKTPPPTVEVNTTLPTAPTDPIPSVQNKLKHQKELAVIDTDKNDTKQILFDISCVDMLCTLSGVDFPKPLLNKILLKTEPEFQWFFNNGSYTQYFVMLPSDTFEFLKIGEKQNEKKYGSKQTPQTLTTAKNNAVPTVFSK